MKTLGVIVPAYREEEGIEDFHARLRASFASLKERYRTHIVYVVDKSPDRTEAKLKRIAAEEPDVSVLVLSRRFGHQAALVAGIDHCNTDIMVMLDSDLQHPPELIPAMVERHEAGAEIVQMIRRDSLAIGPAKRFLSAWFYRVFGRLGPVEIPPGAADFRLLSAKVASVFRTQLREQNPFLRGLVFWVGFNVTFIPFDCDRRQTGATKYSMRRLLSFAANGLCSFSKAPLRLCTILGFVLAAISLVLAGAQILAYLLFSHRDVPGWASLMLALSFATGVQLFFVGILGEYIGLIFDEVKRRPIYVVEATYNSETKVSIAAKRLERA